MGDYYLEWNESDPHEVTIYEAIDENTFALGSKLTDAEREADRAKRAAQTPEQNLRDLMLDHFQSQWRATELCRWFDANCPGYTVRPGKLRRANIRFASLDHAMLFKLTWA